MDHYWIRLSLMLMMLLLTDDDHFQVNKTKPIAQMANVQTYLFMFFLRFFIEKKGKYKRVNGI